MPRPIHFEIQAENVERAIAFYRELLGWEFNQWGKEPYWLVKTGEKGTPGIDGGLMPRRGPGPADMQPVNAFVCTVDVASLDAMVKRVTELRGSIALPKMPIPTVGCSRTRRHRGEHLRDDADGREREVSNAPVRRLTIATRDSALALAQAGHVRARLATLYPEAAVELLASRPRRSRAGPIARRDRRQGAVHQGARAGAFRRPRRPRRALPEGCSDGHAGWFHARGDLRARGSARRIRIQSLSRSRGFAGRRAHRNVDPRRQAQLRERDPLLSIQSLRGTSTRGSRSSIRSGTTRSFSPPRASGGLASRRVSHRCSIPKNAFPPSDRARSRSNAGRIAPTSSPRFALSRSRNDARDDRRARVRTSAFRKLPHASRRACDFPERRAVAARTARERERLRRDARREERQGR